MLVMKYLIFGVWLFSLEGKQDAIGTDIAAALVKNLERIDPKADKSLLRELVCWHSDQQTGSEPLGVVLISKETGSVACGSQFILCKDQPTYLNVTQITPRIALR